MYMGQLENVELNFMQTTGKSMHGDFVLWDMFPHWYNTIHVYGDLITIFFLCMESIMLQYLRFMGHRRWGYSAHHIFHYQNHFYHIILNPNWLYQNRVGSNTFIFSYHHMVGNIYNKSRELISKKIIVCNVESIANTSDVAFLCINITQKINHLQLFTNY